MKILSILFFFLFFCGVVNADSFNPRGKYSGELSLIDIGSIGGYPCGGSIGEIAFYEFNVSFRRGVVSAPYYNEKMKGSVVPNKRAFKIMKKFYYAGLHPTTVTLLAKNITNTAAKMTFIYRLISNSNPLQGCVWTYRGDVSRIK